MMNQFTSRTKFNLHTFVHNITSPTRAAVNPTHQPNVMFNAGHTQHCILFGVYRPIRCHAPSDITDNKKKELKN